MTTVDQLKRLLHEKFDVALESIDPDAPFAAYALDSLGVAELMVEIHDAFDVAVPDAAAHAVRTLRGLAELLDGLLAGQRAA